MVKAKTLHRCPWVDLSKPDYVAYHDMEWGVARYGDRKVEALLADPGIIRNRAKVLASINNAGMFLEVQEEFGSFDAYIWRFVDGKPIVNAPKVLKDYPATSRESDALSADLRGRGFKFVGSTICYAHMQATGMVNDHTVDCFRKKAVGRTARG